MDGNGDLSLPHGDLRVMSPDQTMLPLPPAHRAGGPTDITTGTALNVRRGDPSQPLQLNGVKYVPVSEHAKQFFDRLANPSMVDPDTIVAGDESVVPSCVQRVDDTGMIVGGDRNSLAGTPHSPMHGDILPMGSRLPTDAALSMRRSVSGQSMRRSVSGQSVERSSHSVHSHALPGHPASFADMVDAARQQETRAPSVRSHASSNPHPSNPPSRFRGVSSSVPHNPKTQQRREYARKLRYLKQLNYLRKHSDPSIPMLTLQDDFALIESTFLLATSDAEGDSKIESTKNIMVLMVVGLRIVNEKFGIGDMRGLITNTREVLDDPSNASLVAEFSQRFGFSFAFSPEARMALLMGGVVVSTLISNGSAGSLFKMLPESMRSFGADITKDADRNNVRFNLHTHQFKNKEEAQSKDVSVGLQAVMSMFGMGKSSSTHPPESANNNSTSHYGKQPKNEPQNEPAHSEVSGDFNDDMSDDDTASGDFDF